MCKAADPQLKWDRVPFVIEAMCGDILPLEVINGVGDFYLAVWRVFLQTLRGKEIQKYSQTTSIRCWIRIELSWGLVEGFQFSCMDGVSLIHIQKGPCLPGRSWVSRKRSTSSLLRVSPRMRTQPPGLQPGTSSRPSWKRTQLLTRPWKSGQQGKYSSLSGVKQLADWGPLNCH